MRKITYLLLAFFASLQACIEDEGNYVYEDLVRLSVDSLQKSYQIRSMIDHLTIKPNITSSGDYNCCWMLYSLSDLANINVDTISQEKELNYLVTEPSGAYRLTLCVTDNQTGDALYTSAEVNIATVYNDGWYVLKEINEATDMDMFTLEDEKMENLFLNLFDSHMDGIPMDFSYTPAYTYVDKESIKHYNERILWVCSDQNVYMLKLADMALIYEHDELFYGDIPNDIPYHVSFGASRSYYLYMSSAGIFFLHSASPSSGRFGLPASLENGYALNPLSYNMNNSTVFYDDKNCRFIAMNNGNLRAFSDEDSEENIPAFVPNNLNCDVLMLDRTMNLGFAILKERTTGELLVLELTPSSHDSYSPTFSNPINANHSVRLPASHAMSSATHFALNHNMAYIYYTDGSRICLYDLYTHSIKENLITLNANEKISFLKHLHWNPSKNKDEDEFEYLVIGTTHGDEYTLHFYDLFAGEPNKEVKTLSGTGKIKDVQFISTKMGMFASFSQYPLD